MTAPVLTDEMRQAVHDEDCVLLGHVLSMDNVLVTVRNFSVRVRGPAGWMPHLLCERCGHVWIVIARDGRNYAVAERRFRERLLPTDPEALPPTP